MSQHIVWLALIVSQNSCNYTVRCAHGHLSNVSGRNAVLNNDESALVRKMSRLVQNADVQQIGHVFDEHTFIILPSQNFADIVKAFSNLFVYVRAQHKNSLTYDICYRRSVNGSHLGDFIQTLDDIGIQKAFGAL